MEKIIFQNSFKADVSFYLGCKMMTIIMEEIKKRYENEDWSAL